MINKILKKMGYVKAGVNNQTPTPDTQTKAKYNRFDSRIFKTDPVETLEDKLQKAYDKNFKNSVHKSINLDNNKSTFACDNQINTKAAFVNDGLLPPLQVLWYASQTFIGYQLCAMLAQNWLISKACLMPAKDATRNGYAIKVTDDVDIAADILDDIKKLDVQYKINKNLIEFVHMGRVFGIRIAMFIVDSDDPDYYKKPFNIDGVAPNSYRGISQIDPYWVAPQLDAEASSNPASINFYTPTWWVINGKQVHRTHLVIFKTEEVADILKPTYIFGGIPVPQKICERVYAAERVANEAPLLAMTKRTDVVQCDVGQAAAQFDSFEYRMNQWVANRDNYGVKFIGTDEDMKQFDTNLSDLDKVIMTQYQLVAAAANVPGTKLLDTDPKGFYSKGELQESSYHEELESIQTHDLTPLLDRHHLLLIKSDIAPKYNIEPFHVAVVWDELDAMTAQERAELNKYNAEAGRVLIESGAITPEEERNRVISDPDSGYVAVQSDYDPEPDEIFSDLAGA